MFRYPRIVAGLIALGSGSTVCAHEFMIIPEASRVSAGQPVTLKLTMTETWIRPDRMPPPETVSLALVDSNGSTAVPFHAAENALAATAEARKGPFLLAATMRRDRMEAPRTPEGAPPAKERMTRSETFSKAYVNLTPGETLWAKAIGTRLEIVPLSDPSGLRPGEALRVRVLFEGKPVQARVQAVYDAGGAKGHGFTVRTESDADGTATVPVDRSGLWLVRTRYGREEAHEAYMYYAGGANLVFRVE